MGKLVSQKSVKFEGDLFNLYKFPYQFSQITPNKIQSVDLISGRWGTVGSVITWTYTHDGEKGVANEIIEAMDEKKKSITYKVIEGDLLKYYNTMKIIVEVESNGGDDQNMNKVTWTLEYEKKNQSVSDPTAFMEFLYDYAKDVERVLVPN